MTKTTFVTHTVLLASPAVLPGARNVSSQAWAGRPLRPSPLPPHFIQPQASREAPQNDTSALSKDEVFARDELVDYVGDKDLAGLCTGADAEGSVDGGAEQAPFCNDRLTSVDANTDMHRMGGMLLVMLGECLLDGHGACNGIGGRGEGGLEAVAGMCDISTMVRSQAIADEGDVEASTRMRLLIVRR